MNTTKIAAVVALAAATVLTGCGGQSPSSSPAAAPAPTVTVTAPAKTVTKTVTPQACLDALDYADTGFGYSAESMGFASEAFTAAANLDIDGVEAAGNDLSEVTDKFTALAPDYNAAKAACRDGAS